MTDLDRLVPHSETVERLKKAKVLICGYDPDSLMREGALREIEEFAERIRRKNMRARATGRVAKGGG